MNSPPRAIESVVVEPGAYQTPVFGNLVTAADQSVRTLWHHQSNPVEDDKLLSGTAGNPQEVADAVLRIVETPVGQKKLRYRVSEADLGVDEINTVSERGKPGCSKCSASLPKPHLSRETPPAPD